MQKIVGIRFKSAGKIYHFDPENVFLKVGDNAIVETARGIEFGKVVTKVRYVKEEDVKYPLKPVLRKATQKDVTTYQENERKALEAVDICKKEIEKHKLDMKLIRAEYTFDATKIVFYFTADGRIDFRELVKDLAAIFKIRIELRQIGIRDEAKMVGGLGCCGRELCCCHWMGEFQPVSIKMAKEQGLSLNPGKISGICGRLLCCLQYEQNCYECAIEKMPSTGQKVKTKEGIGIIEKLNLLKETVMVKLEEGDTFVIKEFKNDDIIVLDKKCPKGKKCHHKNNDLTLEDVDEETLKELKALEKNDSTGEY